MAQTYTQAEAKALSHKYASGDIEAARTEISRELNIPSEQVKHLDAAVRVETHKTANPNWNKPTITNIVTPKIEPPSVVEKQTQTPPTKPISEGGKWPSPTDWYAAQKQQAQYLRGLAAQWIAENPAATTTAPADDWRLQADDIDAMSAAFKANGVTAQTPTYDPAYIKATAEWQAWRVANFPARTGKPYVAQTIPGAGEERKPLF
jgi:hypothetical protein